MQFHYCGNPVHDFFHNLFVLMVLAPDWVPGILLARDSLKHRLLRHSHTEDICPRMAEGTTSTGRMCTRHPNTSNPPRAEHEEHVSES